MLSVIMLSECDYTECHYAACHYAEYRGTHSKHTLKLANELIVRLTFWPLAIQQIDILQNVLALK